MSSVEEKKHSEYLGKLVTNMQSLEFALRAFLRNIEIALNPPKIIIMLDKMKEGETVPVTAFTNYDNLKQLIQKYNDNPKVISANMTIDATLVDIRDAIAHGRVSAPYPSSDLTLLKFGEPIKPLKNQVRVTFSVLITEEWLKKQIKRFYDAVIKVSQANQMLQSGKL